MSTKSELGDVYHTAPTLLILSFTGYSSWCLSARLLWLSASRQLFSFKYFIKDTVPVPPPHPPGMPGYLLGCTESLTLTALHLTDMGSVQHAV